MVWFLVFLVVVALALFLAFQLLRLVAFIGAVLITGIGVLLMGGGSLVFLAGLGSFMLAYHLFNSFSVALTIAVFSGVVLPFFVGKRMAMEVRGLIERVKRSRSTEKATSEAEPKKNHLLMGKEA